MNRRSILMIATLIAVFVFSIRSTHAATVQVQNIFIADFSNGQFIGAIIADDNSVKPIKFNATQGVTNEDLFPAYGSTITASVDLESATMTMYSAEYGTMIDLSFAYYTDNHHTIGYCEQSEYNHNLTFCQIDGIEAQFTGPITNGVAIKLRSADAYSTNGTGWIVQDNHLISYAVSNGETTVHTIYMPLSIKL